MKNKVFWIFASSSWLLLAVLFLYLIFSGNIPFWYDPARDMLSAWNNLHKITLIGSTSGIPGIFYGPYWIWLLSIPIFFSKDPRFTVFLVSFIPYMLIFPIVLWRFKKYFDKNILLILWLFFVLSFQSYIIYIWNPNGSPLLFLLVVWVSLYAVSGEKYLNNFKGIFLSGLITGLALNINMSFGSAFTLGLIIFFILNAIIFWKENLITKFRRLFLRLGSFLISILLTFIPFFIFEIRHGFEQIKIFSNALIHGGGGLVGLHGLTKQQIIESFFSRWTQILHIPSDLSLIILVILIAVLVALLFGKKIHFSKPEKMLILLLFSLALSCLGLYLSVKNPVWDYHFIGAEILWILLLGILLSKIPFVQYAAYGWVFILVIMQVVNFSDTFKSSVLTTDSLAAKESVVKIITEDADRGTYSVYVYSPSIYSYEYSYLFRWLAGKDVPYDPNLIKRQKDIYLVLPKENKSILDDFVNYRTPQKLYKTVKTWTIPNETVILKRTLL
jgi:hypothetical protein